MTIETARDILDEFIKSDSEELPPPDTKSAMSPVLSDDAKIKWLASLKPVEYDNAREEAAKELGILASTLDACVKGIRASVANDKDSPFETIEAWHDPVDLAVLLDEICESIRRHIICDRHTANAAALWIAMTYFIDEFDIAPIAIVTAPEIRCGKSELKRLIGKNGVATFGGGRQECGCSAPGIRRLESDIAY